MLNLCRIEGGGQCGQLVPGSLALCESLLQLVLEYLKLFVILLEVLDEADYPLGCGRVHLGPAGLRG